MFHYVRTSSLPRILVAGIVTILSFLAIQALEKEQYKGKKKK